MQSAQEIRELCKLIRHYILTSTTNAGSGHPSSALSAVELMTTLFFSNFFKQDISQPHDLNNDRFILSKGHASPLLYALYRVAGALTDSDLAKLREHNSILEGHPTPLFPYSDVETGSLGQGLSIGLGMALGLRLKLEIRNSKLETNTKFETLENSKLVSHLGFSASNLPKVFVLMGDSEVAEGQVWEAAQLASYYKTNNLIGILDVNRLGQRGETMLGWDLETYKKRFEAFGWNTIIIEDGHNIEQIQQAYRTCAVEERSGKTAEVKSKPIMIIAKTIKGKGVSFLENKDSFHGKPVPKDKLDESLKELGEVNFDLVGKISQPVISSSLSLRADGLNNHSHPELVSGSNQIPKPFDLAQGGQVRHDASLKIQAMDSTSSPLASYKLHDLVATRQAYGDALVELGKQDENVVVLDAEVSNSTFAENFKQAFPDRFFEMFIAEQNMVSVALGLSKIGFKPYISTFGSFLTRAFDQIRMSQYSYANVSFCGSHVGVSIGADGSSQMGLEDISMFRSILNSVVLYPSDANSAIQQLKLLHEHKGIKYLRTTKSPLPVLYTDEEVKTMKIGGSKILHQNPQDAAVVLAAGVTLHEALKAYEHLKNEDISIAVVDLYSIKPIDVETIKKFSHLPMIVVEDHYPAGGIGEAVLATLAELRIKNYELRFTHLCVKNIPHSGSSEENLRYAEIDASAIVKAVKKSYLVRLNVSHSV